MLENVLGGLHGRIDSGFFGTLLGLKNARQAEREAVAQARRLLDLMAIRHLEPALAKDLSGGQQRMVEIVRALATNPPLLLLDEPAVGLSPPVRTQAATTIRRLAGEGLGVLLIEHAIELVMNVSDPDCRAELRREDRGWHAGRGAREQAGTGDRIWAMPEDLLNIARLENGYPGKQILFGVDFAVRQGEVVTLLGANGSGKSTVLNSVSGFVRAWRGAIRFDGEDIAGQPPHAIFRKGVVQVSQARHLFPDMTVEDNLRLGAAAMPKAPVGRLMEECFDHFPRLAERKTQRVQLMSGGEQQMVAIARASWDSRGSFFSMSRLAAWHPSLSTRLARSCCVSRRTARPMSMVEQNIKLALAVADRFLILRDGLVTEGGNVRTAGRSQEDIVRSIYL